MTRPCRGPGLRRPWPSVSHAVPTGCVQAHVLQGSQAAGAVCKAVQGPVQSRRTIEARFHQNGSGRRNRQQVQPRRQAPPSRCVLAFTDRKRSGRSSCYRDTGTSWGHSSGSRGVFLDARCALMEHVQDGPDVTLGATFKLKQCGRRRGSADRCTVPGVHAQLHAGPLTGHPRGLGGAPRCGGLAQ